MTFEPHRVVFSWDISLQWRLETDPTRASEVAVAFVEAGPGRTHVTLVHRHLDGWQSMRDAVGSGWSLDRYAEVASSAG